MITLSSDFGSPYPAAMRGVILQRTDARLVDVAHDFPRQDVRSAAFWLRETLPYFPPAVHLVVVDPGVGTDRSAVVIRAGEHALVGPDNGVLRPVARRLAHGREPTDGREPANGRELTDDRELTDGPAIRAYEIDDADAASSTFHGRDVFAPAAAAVHDADRDRLDSLDRLEPVATGLLVDLELADAAVDDGAGRACGDILAVDDFGNVITNVPGSFLDDADSVLVGVDADSAGGSDSAGDSDSTDDSDSTGDSDSVEAGPVPVGETFAAVDPGDRLATVGSHGYVELDVNRGRGDEAFGLAAGDAVTLEQR